MEGAGQRSGGAHQHVKTAVCSISGALRRGVEEKTTILLSQSSNGKRPAASAELISISSMANWHNVGQDSSPAMRSWAKLHHC
jgi:hypothetical protein